MSTTWNPSDKAASVTLSNTDRTATSSGIGSWVGFRAVDYNQSGYAYFEVSPGNTNQIVVGVANSTWNVNNFPGNDVNSVGFFNVDGTVHINAATVATYGPLAGTSSSDHFCIAVDATYFWVRKNGGNWNNSGTADPATATGGIAHGLTGNIYPVGGCFSAGCNQTAYFEAGQWAQSAPTGFTEFGDFTGDPEISQQYAIVVHEPDPPQNQQQIRISQQYIIVAHSPTAEPPSGAFRYHQPIINLDDGP